MTTTARLLTDDDVRRLPAADAVSAARRALVDAHVGLLAGPPRFGGAAHGEEVVVTLGGYADGPSGFRVYRTGGRPTEQATLVWDAAGRVAALVVGDELGARRTGALGGVAVDVLARSDASALAVVGAGTQAWTQLWAAAAVRRFGDVRIFSRTRESREAFAARAVADLGVPARPVGSAEDAVRGADVVVLATRSDRAVIDASWVLPGMHVTTVGPKTVSAYECPSEVPERAAVAVTDAPDQVAAYPEPCFTSRRLTHLGAVACGDAPGRTGPDDVTFYLSTGLAGSEIVLAEAVLRSF